MSIVISASNFLMESVKNTLNEEFKAKNWQREGSYTFFELATNSKFNNRMISTLTTLITSKLARIWLKRILKLNYGYFDQDERQIISRYADRRLENITPELYQEVYSALADYLNQNDQINLEGFIRFRVKGFWLFLQDTVDEAVDEYLIEREYQEFIKLLRYFVELQEPKIDLANLIVNGTESFQILDYKGEIIETDYLEGVILEITADELDFEDFLISALITIAPARIILHGCEGDHVSETITKIFEERVTPCEGCFLCSEVKCRG